MHLQVSANFVNYKKWQFNNRNYISQKTILNKPPQFHNSCNWYVTLSKIITLSHTNIIWFSNENEDTKIANLMLSLPVIIHSIIIKLYNCKILISIYIWIFFTDDKIITAFKTTYNHCSAQMLLLQNLPLDLHLESW